jgi:hypothetical protein
MQWTGKQSLADIRRGLMDMSHAERNNQESNSPKERLARVPKGKNNTIFPANLNLFIVAAKEFVVGFVP